MVHMSYVPAMGVGPESTRKYRGGLPNRDGSEFGTAARDTERGSVLGPRTWKLPERLRRRRDERGAEMVEFAFVVVLLIALLYGIISYGLVLAAQSTLTQAAADAARSGIVTSSNGSSISAAVTTAENQAANDVGWMDKGCHEPQVVGSAASAITCTATTASCPSNANNTCLTVTVNYNYASSPLFPELPGLGVIMPSTISSTNVLQMSTPSS
jgi:Flp pilus assembly protein TadG